MRNRIKLSIKKEIFEYLNIQNCNSYVHIIFSFKVLVIMPHQRQLTVRFEKYFPVWGSSLFSDGTVKCDKEKTSPTILT